MMHGPVNIKNSVCEMTSLQRQMHLRQLSADSGNRQL